MWVAMKLAAMPVPWKFSKIDNGDNVDLAIRDTDLWQSVAVNMDVFHGNMKQTSWSSATDSENLVDRCLSIDLVKQPFVIKCYNLKTWQ